MEARRPHVEGTAREASLRSGFRTRLQPAHECAGCIARTTWFLIAVWALNLADFVLTARVLQQGVATEGNVLMAHFLDAGLLPAFLFKMGVVTIGLGALWLLRRWRMTLVAATALTAVYTFVVAYQLAIIWQVKAF
jgi:hypothetical protein